MHEPGAARKQGGGQAGEGGDLAEQVACPFCGSTDTALFSLFGQFLLASPYYCCNCRTVFDRVRWADENEEYPDSTEQPR